MKKILYTIFVYFLLTSFNPGPDPCLQFAFFKEGSSSTITSFDGKGKITGSVKTTYEKINQIENGKEVLATSENFDKKGKSMGINNFTMKCINGSLFFDMKMNLSNEQMQAYKNFEVTVDGVDKEIPSSLNVGDNLRDANITLTVKTKNGVAMPMMGMIIKTTNRKVEALENINTAGGSWMCYKITEDMEVQTILSFKLKVTNWFNKQVGVVKTESYDQKGKLAGSTELTEVKL